MCKANGIRVIGTAGSEEGLRMLDGLGIDKAYNHRKAGYVDEIKADGEKINVIIEVLANVNLQTDLDMVAQRGRIVVSTQANKKQTETCYVVRSCIFVEACKSIEVCNILKNSTNTFKRIYVYICLVILSTINKPSPLVWNYFVNKQSLYCKTKYEKNQENSIV